MPALVTGLVGLTVLALLLSWRIPLRGKDERNRYPSGMDTRRGFLVGSGAVIVASAGSAVLGQRLGAGDLANDVHLPQASKPVTPLPQGLEKTFPGITPLRTPNAGFYCVDTALVVPRVDPSSWQLRIEGDVRHPYTLTFEDLLRMPMIERNITMTCVSNEVGGGYVGGARWLGVPTAELLRRAGVIDPGRAGRQVFSTSVDAFTVSTPLGALTDDRDALLAVGMNGAPLPPTHGFPARLVTPGLYGFVGSTKWVTSLRVTTYDDVKAYWTKRDWVTDRRIKPSARIDTPKSLAQLSRGTTRIGGIAWAQRRGVVKVEVSIDSGLWQSTRLGPDVGVDYWRQWGTKHSFTASGRHSIRARVVDATGAVQTDRRAPVFPGGSSGIQEVVVLVQ